MVLKLDNLADQVASYEAGRISFDDFQDWFRTDSRGVYASENEPVRTAVAGIEAALSKFHFQDHDETALLVELARIVSPFSRTVASVRSGPVTDGHMHNRAPLQPLTTPSR
jgi:hypothetical protein